MRRGIHLASTRTALDREKGFRFHLDGKVLTISLAPQPRREPADARRELCGASGCVRRARRAISPTTGRRRAVHVTRLWPEAAHQVAFFFERDISRGAKWCIVEETGGGDIGFAALQPPPGRLLVQTESEADPSAPGPRVFIRLRDSRGRLVIKRRANATRRQGSHARRIRIRPVRPLVLVVTVDPGRGCRIETVAEARRPGG